MLSGVEFENSLVDIYLKENGKPLQFVEVGTKTRSILNEKHICWRFLKTSQTTLKRSA